jgi:UDP-glucose 4-epimerase
MSIYVTGSAGFIGQHVTSELEDLGRLVVECDVKTGTDLWTVDRLPGHVRVVVHLAAIVSARHPRPLEVWREDVGLTAHALRLADRAGTRFVFASSAAAARPDTGAYAAAKHAAERLVLAQGGTVLRYANVHGPGQHPDSILAELHAARQENRRPRINGTGEQTRDFVHVTDVARATAIAALDPAGDGQVLDVCTGRQTRLLDLLADFQPRPDGEPDAIEQDPEPIRRVLSFHAEPLAL